MCFNCLRREGDAERLRQTDRKERKNTEKNRTTTKPYRDRPTAKPDTNSGRHKTNIRDMHRTGQDKTNPRQDRLIPDKRQNIYETELETRESKINQK